MAKMRIKKGDLVQVITGRKQDKGGDRGKQGKVIDVFPETQRVLVEGINRVTKHVKAGQSSRGTRTGGIETVEAPIHISNVQYYDAEAKRGKRLGARTETVQRDGRDRTARVRVTRGHGDAEKDI